MKTIPSRQIFPEGLAKILLSVSMDPILSTEHLHLVYLHFPTLRLTDLAGDVSDDRTDLEC